MYKRRQANQKKSSAVKLSVILIVIGSAVTVGSYFVFDLSNDELTNENTRGVLKINKESNLNNEVIEDKEENKVYTNNEFDFTFLYPDGWQLNTTRNGQGENEIFSVGISSGTDSIGLSVMSDSFEGIVRNSISIDQESEVEIGGLAATKLVGGSAKDGSMVNIVYFKDNGMMYSYSGIGSAFDDIVKSFEIK